MSSGKKVIVFTPTVALGHDQEQGLNDQAGRRVARFLAGGDLSVAETLKTILQDQELAILLLTPEKLAKNEAVKDALTFLHRMNDVLMIAFDEAHHIIEPATTSSDAQGTYVRDYATAIEFVLSLSPPVRLLATTATATQAVRTDIKEKLRFGLTDSDNRSIPPRAHAGEARKSFEIVLPIYRSNIKLQVLLRTGVAHDLHFLIDERFDPDSGLRLAELAEGVGLTLIYVTQTSVADQIQKTLEKGGLSVRVYYKKGREQKEGRAENESAMQAFKDASIDVLVATGQSCGEGIDNKLLRHVILYHVPKSLEQLVQQIGRPGRDGKEARCTIFAAAPDFAESGHTERSREQLLSFIEADDMCRWLTLSKLCGESESAAKEIKNGCLKCDTCCDKDSGLEFDFGREVSFLLDLLYVCGATGKAKAVAWKDIHDRAKDPGTPMRERYDSMPPTIRGQRAQSSRQQQNSRGTTQDPPKLRAFLDAVLVRKELVSRVITTYHSPLHGDRDSLSYHLSEKGEAIRKELSAATELPRLMFKLPWHLKHASYAPTDEAPEPEEEFDIWCVYCGKEVTDDGESDVACAGECAGARCTAGLHTICGAAFGCPPPFNQHWLCPRCEKEEQFFPAEVVAEKLFPSSNGACSMEPFYLVRWHPCKENGFKEDEETWEPLSNFGRLGARHPALLAFREAKNTERSLLVVRTDAPPAAEAEGPSQSNASLSDAGASSDAGPPTDGALPPLRELLYVEAVAAQEPPPAAPAEPPAPLPAAAAPTMEMPLALIKAELDPGCQACQGQHRAHTCSKQRIAAGHGRKPPPIPNGHRRLDNLSVHEVGCLLGDIFHDANVAARYRARFKKEEVTGGVLMTLINMIDPKQGPDVEMMDFLNVSPIHRKHLCSKIKEYHFKGVSQELLATKLPASAPFPPRAFEFPLPCASPSSQSVSSVRLSASVSPSFAEGAANPLSLATVLPLTPQPLPLLATVAAVPPPAASTSAASLPVPACTVRATASMQSALPRPVLPSSVLPPMHSVLPSSVLPPAEVTVVPPSETVGPTASAGQQTEVAAIAEAAAAAAKQAAAEQAAAAEREREKAESQRLAACRDREKKAQELAEQRRRNRQLEEQQQQLREQLKQQQQKPLPAGEESQQQQQQAMERQQQEASRAGSAAELERQRLASLGTGPPLPRALVEMLTSDAGSWRLDETMLHKHLLLEHAEAIVAMFEEHERVCWARTRALMAAILISKELLSWKALATSASPDRLSQLLYTALCDGPRNANRLLRSWFPNVSFFMHNDEELFKKGKSVRYHVEMDEDGKLDLNSFGALAGKSIGTTVAHAVFGVRAHTKLLSRTIFLTEQPCPTTVFDSRGS